MNHETFYKAGDKIGGRFLVHEPLGGGMGEVYLCLDLETIQPYALKTFRSFELPNPKFLKSFEDEVSIWVALEKHPNIVRCFFMDIIKNQPFMFLEWIAGEESRGTDLRSWLRRGPLALRLALDFVIDICRGLIYAGKKQTGIVHCDLKPENILISQGKIAKITDFGLAKIAKVAELEIGHKKRDKDGHQNLRGQKGIFGGTTQYMAPEQWQRKDLDERTDIYAVGCILYEMLTGKLPFQAATLDGLCRQHLKAPIPKLAQKDKFPGYLDTLLAKCLAKRRKERFATLVDLLQHLEIFYQKQFSQSPISISISDDFAAMDYSNRGITYFNLHKYTEALADFEQAIKLDSTDSRFYAHRSMVYSKLKRYDDALDDLDVAVKIDPENSTAYNNRGNIYQELHQYKEAEVEFSYALQLDPNYAKAYYNRGLIYINLKLYKQAIDDLDNAIRLEPTYAKAYLNRGKTFEELREYDNALFDFSQTIQLDPANAKAYYNRGVIYQNLQEYEKALNDYEQAIKLDPNYIDAYLNHGVVLENLQQYDKALTDYNRVIELDPSDAAAYNNRGYIYQIMHQYDKALSNYEQAIQLDPTFTAPYKNRGHTYFILQDYEKSLVDFSRSIKLDPSDPAAYNNRGIIYISLEQCEEALADFKKSIELNPNQSQVHYNIGNLFVESGNMKKALSHFQKAVQSTDLNGNREITSICFDIGSILFKHQELTEALIYFEKAAQLGDSKSMQLIAKIKQLLGSAHVDPVQLASEAFQKSGSFSEMRLAVKEFPILGETNFIGALEKSIRQVAKEHRSYLEERIDWLKKIAHKRKK